MQFCECVRQWAKFVSCLSELSRLPVVLFVRITPTACCPSGGKFVQGWAICRGSCVYSPWSFLSFRSWKWRVQWWYRVLMFSACLPLACFLCMLIAQDSFCFRANVFVVVVVVVVGWLCVYVCVCVCTHLWVYLVWMGGGDVYIYAHVCNMCMHAHICECVRVCTHICEYVCACEHMCIYLHVCNMYMHAHICECVFTCMFVHVCMYVFHFCMHQCWLSTAVDYSVIPFLLSQFVKLSFCSGSIDIALCCCQFSFSGSDRS